MTCRPRSATSRSCVLNRPTRRTNHALGTLALRCRLGRHRADHLVLVLDILEYWDILNGRPAATLDSTRKGLNVVEPVRASAMMIERSCALTAVALSEQRREGARLVTGEKRGFSLDSTLRIVHVPYPSAARNWTRRTLTCGVALQCSPSKDRLAEYRPKDLSAREFRALTLIEGSVALGWVASRWPGLLPEMSRVLPDLEIADGDVEAWLMLDRAIELARTRQPLYEHPLLGTLPSTFGAPRAGQCSTTDSAECRGPARKNAAPGPTPYPSAGTAVCATPTCRRRADPMTTTSTSPLSSGKAFPTPSGMRGRKGSCQSTSRFSNARIPVGVTRPPISPDLRKWFEEHTHRAMTNRLEDGSDLDVDSYVSHYIDMMTGEAKEPRIFRELLPSSRDVTTALLLDASSSLGVHGGRIFRLELACADALSRAMTHARERHGIFTFTGNTRHHVDVRCLKDFQDIRIVAPSGLGLMTGGYTRLGAPVRHLTSRLLAQPSERRLLIVIGDGLMSDEGYEGRYAWADVAHAVEEANEAGVSVYYVGVGPTRVDPLPEVFGPRRSQRIRRVEELPRILAHVHRELVAA